MEIFNKEEANKTTEDILFENTDSYLLVKYTNFIFNF